MNARVQKPLSPAAVFACVLALLALVSLAAAVLL